VTFGEALFLLLLVFGVPLMMLGGACLQLALISWEYKRSVRRGRP
jgi:hypothetical protein